MGPPASRARDAATAICLAALCLPLSGGAERGRSAERPEASAPRGGSPSGPGSARATIARPSRRRVPRSPEEARDPRVAAALRAAPPRPPPSEPYVGRSLEMHAAEGIRRRPLTLPLFREATPLGAWRTNPYAEFRVRRADECLAEARGLGLPVRPYVPADPTKRAYRRVPVPVIFRGEVDGVAITMHRRSAVVVSCELATRLPLLARAAARNGIVHVSVCSAYRRRPAWSFHAVGMALDIHRVRVATPLPGARGAPDEWLSVDRDFVETPDRRTCDPALLGPASPLDPRARALLGFACDLHDTGAFATVLTPNYDAGHRDHFHVDVRPDDPRTFVR